MRSRTWIIAGLAAAAVIVAGAVTVDNLPGRSTAEGSNSTSSTHSSTAPSPSSKAPSTPGAPTTGSPAPTPGGDPSGPPQSKRFTTEVIHGAGAGKGLPKSTALPEPVSNPLPKTASATGSLAAGYPSKVLPVATASSIGTSSVATQGQHVQVTLTATSSMPVTEVLAFYRTALAKYGMYDTAAPALGGATALTFRRGTNSVTLTASPVTGGTKYIIYGAFTAKN
jgi:hypothetical protein